MYFFRFSSKCSLRLLRLVLIFYKNLQLNSPPVSLYFALKFGVEISLNVLWTYECEILVFLKCYGHEMKNYYTTNFQPSNFCHRDNSNGMFSKENLLIVASPAVKISSEIPREFFFVLTRLCRAPFTFNIIQFCCMLSYNGSLMDIIGWNSYHFEAPLTWLVKTSILLPEKRCKMTLNWTLLALSKQNQHFFQTFMPSRLSHLLLFGCLCVQFTN